MGSPRLLKYVAHCHECFKPVVQEHWSYEKPPALREDGGWRCVEYDNVWYCPTHFDGPIGEYGQRMGYEVTTEEKLRNLSELQRLLKELG